MTYENHSQTSLENTSQNSEKEKLSRILIAKDNETHGCSLPILPSDTIFFLSVVYEVKISVPRLNRDEERFSEHSESLLLFSFHIIRVLWLAQMIHNFSPSSSDDSYVLFYNFMC
jgi:hypothetical protein